MQYASARNLQDIRDNMVMKYFVDSIYYSNLDPRQYLNITYDEIMGIKKDEDIDAESIVMKVIKDGGLVVK